MRGIVETDRVVLDVQSVHLRGESGVGGRHDFGVCVICHLIELAARMNRLGGFCVDKVGERTL